MARAWNADDIGFTPDDYREWAWEEHREDSRQRWKALAALWGRPQVNTWGTAGRTDGVIEYTRKRDCDWTLWRGFLATAAIILNRRREGGWGHEMAYWDAGPIYGGWRFDAIELHPGCQFSLIHESETSM